MRINALSSAEGNQMALFDTKGKALRELHNLPLISKRKKNFFFCGLSSAKKAK